MGGFLKDITPKLCFGGAIAGAIFLGVPAASMSSVGGLLDIALAQHLPLALVGTALARLLLSILRDELFAVPVTKSRDDILEEPGAHLKERPIVSNRSLILSSLFTLLVMAVEPSLCLTVATASLGWESSGVLYNVIGRIYPS